MAITRMTAKRDGWRLQAESLALTHTATGTAAIAVAKHARRRRSFKPPTDSEPSAIELANELKQTRAQLAEGDTALAHTKQRNRFLTERIALLEFQMPREITAAPNFNEQVKTLAGNAHAISELEDALGAAREELVLQENENHSLQVSLNLMDSENSRLSACITESAVAADQARTQLEKMKTALDWFVAEHSRLSRRLAESDVVSENACDQLEQIRKALSAAEAERNKLGAAMDEANEMHRTEIDTLSTLLKATSARAAAAERLLTHAQQKLLVRAAESGASERDVAEAVVARNAMNKKLELLQSTLLLKEREVEALVHSRSNLIEGTGTLLKTLEARDTARVRAEGKIKLLSERFAQLEAKASFTKGQDEIGVYSPPQLECVERAFAKAAYTEAPAIFVDPPCECAKFIGENHKYVVRTHLRSIETLDCTISF
jgi:chromosome segregation ATPase